MKCLIWICGLVALQDADVLLRARALRRMEGKPQTTLKELAAEVQHFLDIRQDAVLLEPSSEPHANVLDSQKSRNREPPSPCFRLPTTNRSTFVDATNATSSFDDHRGYGACSSWTLSTLNSLATRLRKKFLAVFAPGLGCCTKSKAKLALKPDSKPVFLKARPVPYATMPRISTEIDRLVSIHVLKPVDHLEWAAPIVIVEKRNGSIRLCADYSTGLNDALEQNQHQLPTPEDTFAMGRYFSQLDLAEAYLRLEVDDVSKQLLTINMDCIASTDYHLERNQLLIGAAAYLDDILVTGRTIGEHSARLERIQDYGLRVLLDKCAFLQTEINYLGFLINTQGRRPDTEKTKAIHKMPAPNDVSQLLSFLGFITFYGNFVKDLHNLRAPLDTITKKDVVYTWTPECQSSFDKIKAILSSDLLLTHFDPSFPIIVAADASNYGIGATLSHRFADGCEKIIYRFSSICQISLTF
ncbi:hypothetical protein RB195_014409 [Necator americanus]|uniref:Reverse transcriptase/retrotransposon-derived protein RNase H-like domain-containing protein n=1 Tax=Necator americanus TaxID=51031 RepID=A0ABR1E165_NECAM